MAIQIPPVNGDGKLVITITEQTTTSVEVRPEELAEMMGTTVEGLGEAMDEDTSLLDSVLADLGESHNVDYQVGERDWCFGDGRDL